MVRVKVTARKQSAPKPRRMVEAENSDDVAKMATKTPQTPTPSPRPANPSRNVPPRRPPQASPSVTGALSPSFSLATVRSRLGATATAAADSSSTPCIILCDWWPVMVEGDERKLAVAGITERDQSFTSTPIAKRYDLSTLQTEDRIVVYLQGSLSILRMRENGFSIELCEKFLLGFPYWWQSWKTRIISRPNSGQFYLERFQLGKFLDSVGSSFIEKLLKNAENSPNDGADAVPECSDLPNGTSRFEEYTCGGDISAQEKTAASNELGDGRIDLVVGSTSEGIRHVKIECNASLAPTEKPSSDETCKEAGNQNDVMHPDARNQEAGSHLFNPVFFCNLSPDHIHNDLEDVNTMAGSSVDPVDKHNLAPVLPERVNSISEIADTLENMQPLSFQKTQVASLTNQGCPNRTPHRALNRKVAPNENTSTPGYSDVQSRERPADPGEKQKFAREVSKGPTRSPMTRTPIRYGSKTPLTCGKVNSSSISTPESLNLTKTRSGRMVVPTLDPGSERIVYDEEGMIMGVAKTPLKARSKRGTPASAKRKRSKPGTPASAKRKRAR